MSVAFACASGKRHGDCADLTSSPRGSFAVDLVAYALPDGVDSQPLREGI
jgi:hypothetical protein